MSIAGDIKSGLGGILFPEICMLCGMPLTARQHFLCADCLEMRFEKAYLSAEERINMPEFVQNRFALWKFDKGGYLQDLLHSLKYHRLTGIGIDLGVTLGSQMRQIFSTEIMSDTDTYLLPVPLHSKKKRLRGYNQAYYIAKGVENIIGINIIPEEAVVRVKNTKTQTGFSLEKRRKNIAEAFAVNMPAYVAGKHIIIVDDVFTTGATAFELAGVLHGAGAKSISVATVAQA